MIRPYRIAAAGTHSTGKSTFLTALQREFEARNVAVAYVHDSAVNAQAAGFPILSQHTFESTAWLIARAIELETHAWLTAEVVLVDRPVADALGYLMAALEHTGRQLEPSRLDRLAAICEAWSAEYDLVFLTVLDAAMPLGYGRDDDAIFRELAGQKVAQVVDRYTPDRRLLHNDEQVEAVRAAVEAYEVYRNCIRAPV